MPSHWSLCSVGEPIDHLALHVAFWIYPNRQKRLPSLDPSLLDRAPLLLIAYWQTRFFAVERFSARAISGLIVAYTVRGMVVVQGGLV